MTGGGEFVRCNTSWRLLVQLERNKTSSARMTTGWWGGIWEEEEQAETSRGIHQNDWRGLL
jgi:hypothetical protein